MHNVGPLDVFTKDGQQLERNGMTEQLVTITNPATIDLHVVVVWYVETTPEAVAIRGQNSYATAKLGQPPTQPVPGAYGATIRPRRKERGAHMKNSHRRSISQADTAARSQALEP